MPLHGDSNLLATYGRHESNLLSSPPKGRKRFSWTKLLTRLFFIFLTLVALFIIFVGFNARSLSSVYSSANQGRLSLELSLEAAKRSDFSQASFLAQEAVLSFEEAQISLNKVKLGPLRLIPLFDVYRQDIAHLIAAGRILSETLGQGTDYVSSLTDVIGPYSNIKFSELPSEEKQKLLAVIYNADNLMIETEEALGMALLELEAVRSFSWFGDFSGRLEDLKIVLRKSQGTLTEAAPLTRLLPPLFGYPEAADYLLIFQNNDELRPTGGFIGTYGLIRTKDGDFERFETHDIYHLDIPVEDLVEVEPPYEIRRYLVQRWYMRDANWSPDWPTTAEKLLWFYDLENSVHPEPDPVKNFNGVIGVTPELIVDLLKITGPIEADGDIYDQDNFVELLQYRVEVEYARRGESGWDRKSVIGEISRQMKERLFDLPLERWPEMIEVVSDNMLRKNILLYHKDEELQKLIRQQGWSGEIRQEWGDYLFAVDANLAALKTDSVMQKEIVYEIKQSPEGRLIAKTTLNYSHAGGSDWRTSNYRTYSRIFVPEGSRLIASGGYTDGEVGVGRELGKTFFGAFLNVEPGEIGQLYFEYELPAMVAENMKKYQNYRLIVQKQPGRQNTSLKVDLNFLNEIKSYEPAALSIEKIDVGQLNYKGDMRVDRAFLINF